MIQNASQNAASLWNMTNKYILLGKILITKIIRFTIYKINFYYEYISLRIYILICGSVLKHRIWNISPLWSSIKLKLYTSKNIIGKEVDFILATLVILKYFKKRHAKLTYLAPMKRYIFSIEFMKASNSKANVGNNFILRFILVCLVFLNWSIRIKCRILVLLYFDSQCNIFNWKNIWKFI